MKFLEYPLFTDGFINRFVTVGPFVKANPYTKTVLHGKVNGWLDEDSDLYDHPCRKEVYQKRVHNPAPYIDISGNYPGDEITVFEQKKRLAVYFPFDNYGVDDSGFYNNPAYLRSYGCTWLAVPQEEDAEFELTTCGALTVWVNDEQVSDFVPFTRNRAQSTVICVKLRAGMNKLIVCLDDIAERDTGYAYRVRYMGSQKIRVLVGVNDDVDENKINLAEQSLADMYFEKEAYLSEKVVLTIQAFSDDPADLMLYADRSIGPVKYTLQPGAKELLLFDADQIPSNFYYFKLVTVVCGLPIGTVIGTYILNTQYMGYHENLYEERIARIKNIISDADRNNDYRAVIRLTAGETPDNLSEILANHLRWVNEKRDCSDFRLIIMVYMYVKFSSRFPEDLKRDVEDAMAGYRYWIDEPSDDVMWFFSENHALMFHICQYFAGQSMPERIFTCSGLTGAQAMKKAEGLLNLWFESFFTEFATEWNSSTYLPIDIMGLAYLYDLTPADSPLHTKSKEALDMLSFCLAVNEHKGTIMTSFGRTYERELKGSYSTGMTSLLYLLYNAGYMNEHFRALVPIIVGDYKPPQEYARYVNLRGDEELIFQNTQGINQCVNLYLYKNANALLSTAVGLRPFESGYQENVVQATLDLTVQIFINQPGEVQVYGNGRPGFWAGNGSLPFATQYRNVSILEFRIDDQKIPFTHAYIPLVEFSHYMKSRCSIALEKNGGYIGVRTLTGLTMQNKGPCRNREFISYGLHNIWVIKVGIPGQYESVEDLLTEMDAIQIVMDENRGVTVTDGNMLYEIKNDLLYVNNTQVHHYPLNPKGVITFNHTQNKSKNVPDKINTGR